MQGTELLIVMVAKYLIIVPIIVLAAYFFLSNKQVQKRMVVLGGLGSGLAFILSRIGSALFYDPRPFVTQQIQPLIAHAADNGFPSDHALLSFTLAAVLYTFNRKWGMILGVMAVVISAARVAASVHSWIDIGGSFVISAGSIYLVDAGLRHLPLNSRLARWIQS